MQKLLLAFAATASLALAACGNDDGEIDNNTNNTNNGSCAVEANFTSIHDNLLSQSPGCAQAGCHDGTSSFGGLNFTAGKAEVYRQLTEDAVMNAGTSATLRVDSAAENSFLYIRLTNMGATGPMPPAGGLIPDCQQQAIKAWIDGGAPND